MWEYVGGIYMVPCSKAHLLISNMLFGGIKTQTTNYVFILSVSCVFVCFRVFSCVFSAWSALIDPPWRAGVNVPGAKRPWIDWWKHLETASAASVKSLLKLPYHIRKNPIVSYSHQDSINCFNHLIHWCFECSLFWFFVCRRGWGGPGCTFEMRKTCRGKSSSLHSRCCTRI